MPGLKGPVLGPGPVFQGPVYGPMPNPVRELDPITPSISFARRNQSASMSWLQYAALWPINVWTHGDGLGAFAGLAALYWANNYSWDIFRSPEVFIKAYGASVGAVWMVDAAGYSKRA